MPARLKAARLNAGLSIRGAADKIGVSYGALKRAEDGDTVQVGTAKRIADFWGYKVTDIWPVLEDEAA